MGRKSKREIERKVEQLEPDLSQEYPILDNLSELWAYEWESVDSHDQLLRREETGQVYYVDPEFEQAVTKMFSDG